MTDLDHERARKRQWDHDHRARCACGRLTGKYNQKRCVRCRRRADRKARDVRRRQIAALWRRGATQKQIAAALDTTPGTISVTMTRMRKDGWDLPLRPQFGVR